jgi:hypothetical protein
MEMEKKYLSFKYWKTVLNYGTKWFINGKSVKKDFFMGFITFSTNEECLLKVEGFNNDTPFTWRYEGQWNGDNSTISKKSYEEKNRSVFFEGNFVKNDVNGYGTKTTKIINYRNLQNQIHKYEGEFKDSEYCGQGKLTINFVGKEKDVYEGNFKNNLLDGKGKFTVDYNNGKTEVYEGDFVKELFHGKGKLTQRDNKFMRTYEGDFKKNERHGQGKLTIKYKEKIYIYRGKFLNDVFQGKEYECRKKDTNNETVKYTGDLKRGNGILYIPHGQTLLFFEYFCPNPNATER